MAVSIKLKSGAGWYTDGEIADVRAAIDQGTALRVWWFAAWGQRFTETAWIAPDELAYLVTESDDG